MEIKNEAVMDLLRKRYLLPDEGLGQWVERVSMGNDEIRSYVDSLDFLPNSPALMNCGTDLGQLAACFVLPVQDSIEGIYDTLKAQALIHKSGGGTGFNFSSLRPEGSTVKSTNGVASGPCTFMRAFNTSTDVIRQGGKRRGANMGILDITHPDIRKFVHLKADASEMTNFNLSVNVTAWSQFANTTLMKEIASEAWATGEPGVLFQDNINKNTPARYLKKYGPIKATNPCGEQPLYPYEACILGSINLSHFVSGSVFLFDKYRQCIRAAIAYLDDMIDVAKWPLPEIEQAVKRGRRIGLGVMGFADCLIKLGVPYDSPAAIDWSRKLGAILHDESYNTSIARGKNLGNAWGVQRRNVACNTIAPTGTLSLIAGCSSGIEPLFALSFVHHTTGGQDIQVVNPLVEDALRGYPTAIMLAEKTGSLKGIHDMLPPHFKDLLKTANEIPWEQHIRIQAAWQEFIDSSISKTINMPKSAMVDDVAAAYRMAYKMGCKGITIYRDGCRPHQVLTAGAEKKEEPTPALTVVSDKVPDCLEGHTSRARTGCGKIYLTQNYYKDKLKEVFLTFGRSGGCKKAFMEVIGRLISTGLKYGITPKELAKQLKGVKCSHPFYKDKKKYESCLDMVGQMIYNTNKETEKGLKCPNCGSTLLPQGGCWSCPECGFSKCE